MKKSVAGMALVTLCLTAQGCEAQATPPAECAVFDMNSETTKPYLPPSYSLGNIAVRYVRADNPSAAESIANGSIRINGDDEYTVFVEKLPSESDLGNLGKSSTGEDIVVGLSVSEGQYLGLTIGCAHDLVSGPRGIQGAELLLPTAGR